MLSGVCRVRGKTRSMKSFKTYRLDTVNHLLWRNGERVPLAPKGFDVLAYLVEHAGRVVAQDELLGALWPETFVNPEVLRKYILEIRRALGVYVVGAIDPADRAVVEAHLAWCVDCREELARLAGLPGQLGSVPAADVTRLILAEPGPAGREAGDRPDAALRALLDRVAALRRHLRWRRMTAACTRVSLRRTTASRPRAAPMRTSS